MGGGGGEVRQGRKVSTFLIKIEISIKRLTTACAKRTGSSWRAGIMLSCPMPGVGGFPGAEMGRVGSVGQKRLSGKGKQEPAG